MSSIFTIRDHEGASRRRGARAVPGLRACTLGLAVVCMPGCMASRSVAPLPGGGVHVLFVGNSLTIANDLPGTLTAVAALGGDTVRAGSSTAPGIALIDHLNGATDAVSRIRKEPWDFVILQQGPTPAGICRDSLTLWTQMFDDVIRPTGARTAVFFTWPLQGPLAWFDGITESFRQAAAAAGAVSLPVGEAWRLSLVADSTLPLYSADGLHPQGLGTYLAALTIYERVTGHDARALPPRAFAGGRDLSVPEATVRALQEAAHQANADFPARARDPAPPAPRASGAC